MPVARLIFLNPFSYDTVSFTASRLDQSNCWLRSGYKCFIDTRPIRTGYATGGLGGAMEGILNAETAITVEANVDAGLSLEGALTAGFTGSEGGVLDQTGVNLIGRDGLPVNYGAVIPPLGEPSLVIQGSTTLDPYAANGIASAQTWTAGWGAGFIDLSATIVNITDWVGYMHKDILAIQFPENPVQR
jgi:hypothetical protein